MDFLSGFFFDMHLLWIPVCSSSSVSAPAWNGPERINLMLLLPNLGLSIGGRRPTEHKHFCGIVLGLGGVKVVVCVLFWGHLLWRESISRTKTRIELFVRFGVK